jgi:hypothetical protein
MRPERCWTLVSQMRHEISSGGLWNRPASSSSTRMAGPYESGTRRRVRVLAAGLACPLQRCAYSKMRLVECSLLKVRFAPDSDRNADIVECPSWARFGLSASQQNAPLFDHLVGDGEHARRYIKTEGLSSSEIDDKFELAWLQHGKLGWFLVFKDAPDVAAGLAIGKHPAD